MRYASPVGEAIEFDWDDENTKHLAAHKVTRAEFEQAMNSDPIDLDCDVIDDEDRYRAVGVTDNGAFLLLVYTIRNGEGPGCDRIPRQCLESAEFSGETMSDKKQTKRIIVPKFATEAEEADWWYKNRKAHDRIFSEAVKAGEARILTKEKLLARIEASKKKPATVVALRIPAADLALARKQAERKGLPYQTYIKSLLHETLTEREERKAG
jgi:predicted DNA binding CopG/RHH family protein/uncharacterized DUF497 family protein